MDKPKLISSTKCFEGRTEVFEHLSISTKTPMRFAVHIPPQARIGTVPVLYFLSGLTCTEQNFITKSGAQRAASALGVMLVAPDTSPRGANIHGEEESWDFGTGAGFYVNATQGKWAEHYRMYDYVTEELPQIIGEFFPAEMSRQSISGHSMGGHGALICALKNPLKYRSVSAFSPICAPSQCPWGEKAFGNYLGNDKSVWAEWDANELIKKDAHKIPILIDQGTEDQFLDDQLKPGILRETCAQIDHPINLRMQSGYDHSYYFISTFIDEHIEYHSRALYR